MMIDSDASFYFLTIVYSTTHHMCTTSSALAMLGFSIYSHHALCTLADDADERRHQEVQYT